MVVVEEKQYTARGGGAGAIRLYIPVNTKVGVVVRYLEVISHSGMGNANTQYYAMMPILLPTLPGKAAEDGELEIWAKDVLWQVCGHQNSQNASVCDCISADTHPGYRGVSRA